MIDGADGRVHLVKLLVLLRGHVALVGEAEGMVDPGL